MIDLINKSYIKYITHPLKKDHALISYVLSYSSYLQSHSIVLLVYFLINGGTAISSLSDQNSVQQSKRGIGAVFAKAAGSIIGMIFLSIILAIIFIVLCSKFPKFVVYSGIIFTFLCYLAIIVLGIIIHQWVLTFIVGLVAIVNAVLLYCWREQIKIGIVLLGASGTFMLQKPTIAVIGFLSLLINIVFLIFYVLGWISAYSQTLPQNNSSESSRDTFNSLMIVFIFMGIYLGYFLYYLMVFVLATAVAYWYYQQQQHILYGYKTVSKHVGSLALASLIITIITILRRLAQGQAQNSQNIALRCIWCFLACILRCIQGFVQVLNHNSIIVMSVTGQNYFSCAKTTIGLISNNFPLFWIVDFISNFIHFYAIILCVLIPAIIGGGIIWGSQDNSDTAVIGGIIIFLLSWIVTSIILGLLYEALSSVFIMFCFDRKLRLQGFVNGNIPQQIKKLFNDVQHQQTFSIVHNNADNKGLTQNQLNKDKNLPSLDSDINFVKQPFKKQRKRKLARKHEIGKKVDQKSEDKSQQFSMSEDGPKNNHESNYPIGNDDFDDKFRDSIKTNENVKLHPFYLQQSEFKK